MLVINKRPKIVSPCPGLVLLPGANHVRDEEWAKVAGGQFVQARLANGTLEVVVAPKEDGAGAASSPKQMSAADAVKLVSQTYDEELLTDWLDEEKRSTVVAAIEKQFDRLEEAGKGGVG